MAKIIEQVFAIKLSRIVNDRSDLQSFLSADQIQSIVDSVPQLIESIVDDSSVIVEVIEVE